RARCRPFGTELPPRLTRAAPPPKPGRAPPGTGLDCLASQVSAFRNRTAASPHAGRTPSETGPGTP
ncbi:MAG: hypothetical protein LBT40_07110, partial [Deltaproteobacteria bacterium]|nr:hypothetical protein [Deltaproteobacteria bacterium]